MAAGLLRDALGLWRGPAIAELDTLWAARIRDELHAEKFSAELDYCDVQFRRGEHASVLVELTGRAEEHPLDERPARQLLRRRLADELDADPALPSSSCTSRCSPPPRRSTHRARGARPASRFRAGFPHRPRCSSAAPPRRARRGGGAAERGGPAGLDLGGGRVRRYRQDLPLHWAHHNLGHFPDGRLYANLRGFDDGAEPVRQLAWTIAES